MKLSLFERLLPVFLWLLISVLPLYFTYIYFQLSARQFRAKIRLRAKDLLTYESLRLQSILKPMNFLSNELEFSRLNSFRNKNFNRENTKENYVGYKNILLRRMSPDYNSFNIKSLYRLNKKIKNRTGIEPSIILTISPKAKECLYIFKKPFRLLTSKAEFVKSLVKTHANMMNKFNIHSSKKRMSFREDKIVKQHLGVHNGFFRYAIDTPQRFSSISKSTIQGLIIPILKDDNCSTKTSDYLPKFVFIGIDLDKLNASFIVDKVSNKEKKMGMSVKLGYSRKQAPYYYEDSDNFYMLAEIPLNTRMLINSNEMTQGLNPVLKIALSRNFLDLGIFGSTEKVKFFFLFISLLMLFIILKLLNFKHSKSIRPLKKTLFYSIFISCLVPILFAMAFLLFFMKIDSQNRLDRVFAFMNNKLDEFDSEANISRERTLMYTNMTALNAERYKTKTFEQVADKFKLGVEMQRTSPLCFLYKTIQVIDGKGKVYTSSVSGNFSKFKKASRPITMILKKYLLEMGFFKNLSRKEKRKIETKYQTEVAAAEDYLPLDKISLALKYLGQINNSIAIAPQSTLITHLIKASGSKVYNMFIMFLIHREKLYHEFISHFVKNKIGKNLYTEGFKTNFYLYKTSYANQKELSINGIDNISQKTIRMLSFATSLYNTGKYIRKNNLYLKKEPNLVYARLIGKSRFFIMGYAIPTNSETISRFAMYSIVILLFFSVVAFILSLFVTNFLLRPIPPVLTAIDELKHDNFSWKLDLEAGDEFLLLQNAFNNLSIKLLERNKMKQLVSEDVSEMVASGVGELEHRAKKVKASILFSDIRGFTTISEKYDPELVVDMLNDYFSAMLVIIQKYNGKINQLIGDAIQAVFYDSIEESSAVRAVQAGIEMRRKLVEFNNKRAKKGLFVINNGVGISTGAVISAVVGSKTGRLDSAIIGEPAILSEELEGYTKRAKHSRILVDNDTYNSVSTGCKFAKFTAVDKSIETDVYEIVDS